jgi:hypothetical protein
MDQLNDPIVNGVVVFVLAAGAAWVAYAFDGDVESEPGLIASG